SLQVKVALRSVFEAPTIASLAEKIASARQEVKRERVVPSIVPVPRDQELPLSFAQQRLWFLNQLMPDNVSYNIPLRLRLRGALDVPLLERCLNEIVSRHEALRTTFASVEGRGVQVVSPLLNLVLPTIDLRRFDAVEGETEVLRLAVEEGQRTFDL